MQKLLIKKTKCCKPLNIHNKDLPVGQPPAINKQRKKEKKLNIHYQKEERKINNTQQNTVSKEAKIPVENTQEERIKNNFCLCNGLR